MSERQTRIAEIEGRLSKATEGPWSTLNELSPPYKVVNPAGDAELGNWTVSERIWWGENARFIAHARSDIPWLVSELRAADEREAKLREALEKLAGPDKDALIPIWIRRLARAALASGSEKP